MRLLIVALLQLLIFLPIVSFAADSIKTRDTQKIQKAGIAETYGKLPLYFIENKGQVDKAVKFYEKGAGHATFFTEDGVVLALTKSEGKLKDIKADKHTTEAVKLSFIDANKEVKINSSSPLPGHVNYFVGNDKTKWQSNIPTYKAVTYKNIYKNIDIKFYGNNRDIEHDIIVHPGGDPSLVKFTYEGIKGLKITDNGDLEVSLNNGKIIERRPIIYQDINGERMTIEGNYRILKGEDNRFTYGYKVASYDHTKKLVIDPVLEYSTYLGGSAQDIGYDIAVDSSGAAYVTGEVLSTGFPLMWPIQGTLGGGSDDVFITKMDPTGTTLVYSTYIGGSAGEIGESIAVDNSGAVYVTGTTGSNLDFPIVNPIQGTFGGSSYDAFLVKINPVGSAIVYSTYLGGSFLDYGYAIALDSAGAVYLTGRTTSLDFPTLNPIQVKSDSHYHAFVTKIDAAGSALVYSTYLGGSTGNEDCYDIAVDSTGAAYVTGITSSTDFPIINPIQGALSGYNDGFITKINPAGSAYLYSTYLGSSGMDWMQSIAVDSSGAVYVTGHTDTGDFPLVNPIQVYGGGPWDALVTKINPTGSSIVYSTYLGGSYGETSNAIAVDAFGAAYVTGSTASTLDFPLVDSFKGYYWGWLNYTDTTVTKINSTGTAITFSTLFGGSYNDSGYGIALDDKGSVYIIGQTASRDFPLVTPIQNALNGGNDAFISKITISAITVALTPDVISVTGGSTLGYTITAGNNRAVKQCFDYWENVTLSDSSTYPVTGELLGPINLCLAGGASQTIHLTHGVPMTAPVGRYAFNVFVGTHPTPLISEAHFTFDVTALGPITKNPQTSWRLIENGLK